MELKCGQRCLKLFLVLCNALFILLGVALLALAVYAFVDGAVLRTFYSDVGASDSLPVNSIGIGAVLTMFLAMIMPVVGALGTAAVAKKHSRMLVAYMGLQVFVLLLLIAAMSLNGIRDVREDEVKTTLAAYSPASANFLEKSWDAIQREYKCCGANGYADWANLNAAYEDNKVPASCCSTQHGIAENDLDACRGDYSNYTATGCFVAFENLVEGHATAILSVAGGSIAVLIANSVLAFFFYRRMDALY